MKEPVPRSRMAGRTVAVEAGGVPAPRPDDTHESIAEREFLRQHAPPFALITASGEVVYVSQRMTDFVAPAANTPSNAIDAYLLRELRVPVRSALKEAMETDKPATVRDVLIESKGKMIVYDVLASAVAQDGGQYLVTLSEVRSAEKSSLKDAVERRGEAGRDLLEVENFNLRRQLDATLQDFETSGQELKSSNEERRAAKLEQGTRDFARGIAVNQSRDGDRQL